MADNKLNMNILRQALTDRTDATDKEAGLFLKAFAEQIVEGLKSGEQVKINGLGTFRLQEMAPRKSVNVNTGEAIVIPGYKKAVFSPEVSIREMVENNGRVAAVNLNEQAAPAATADEETLSPIEKLGRQADEIVDLLADLGQGPKAVKNAEVQEDTEVSEASEAAETIETAAEREVIQESTIAEKEAKTEGAETAAEETKEEAAEEETATEEVATDTQETEERKEETDTEEVKPDSKKPGKRFNFWRDTLICVACLIAILAGGFFFLRYELGNWIDGIADGREQTAADTMNIQPQPVPVDTLPIPVATKTVIKEQPERPVYTSFIATEEIREGSRLTWLAYRYYGNKALWVYIYDANKDHLGNPNNIKTGTPIRIPKLTEAQRDTTLNATRETLRLLEQEAMSRK